MSKILVGAALLFQSVSILASDVLNNPFIDECTRGYAKPAMSCDPENKPTLTDKIRAAYENPRAACTELSTGMQKKARELKDSMITTWDAVKPRLEDFFEATKKGAVVVTNAAYEGLCKVYEIPLHYRIWKKITKIRADVEWQLSWINRLNAAQAKSEAALLREIQVMARGTDMLKNDNSFYRLYIYTDIGKSDKAMKLITRFAKVSDDHNISILNRFRSKTR